MPKVLVVATSHKTRGGITSVIKAHELGEQWKRYNCHWIETHRDKNVLVKMFYLIRGFIQYFFLLPFYDMIHIHMSEPVSALRKIPFMIYANLWKKKTIVHFHSFSPETTIHSKYRWAYRYLFSHADCVITLSEYWRKAVTYEFELGGRVVVVYNPCTALLPMRNEQKLLAEEEMLMPKRNQILYAGTVNARKGYADMIRAFAKIAFRHKDWMIVFAGNGETDKGQKLAEELDIASQTLFLGWVSGADKERAFREATVFCLPSYAEGFPMAVLDAWSYGLPVITTPVGGIPDVAKDGENMLLFQPGDVDELARQMERMILDRELRARISSESLVFAETIFNINTINRQLGNLYAEIFHKKQ